MRTQTLSGQLVECQSTQNTTTLFMFIVRFMKVPQPDIVKALQENIDNSVTEIEKLKV